MPTRQGALPNHLLTALPVNEFERLSAPMDTVQPPLGEVIYESGGELRHVCVPTTAIVSLLYLMEDGASAEMAVVGNDGIVGVALFMGGESMPNRAVVQSAGHACRLPGPLLEKELRQIRSVAYRKAQEIRGKADAEATRVYGSAYNSDPEFHAFSRTLESHKEAQNKNSVLILTTDGDSYRYLKEAGSRGPPGSASARKSGRTTP